MKNEQIVYLDYSDAQDLVERIANRVSEFNQTMSEPEKEAMAQLLSDIGVKTSDLINVDWLADNYAINAEIVTPEDAKNYDNLCDSLFQWEEDGETYYCYQW